MVTYAGLAQFKQEEPEKSNSRSATNHSSVKFQLFQHLDNAQMPQKHLRVYGVGTFCLLIMFLHDGFVYGENRKD